MYQHPVVCHNNRSFQHIVDNLNFHSSQSGGKQWFLNTCLRTNFVIYQQKKYIKKPSKNRSFWVHTCLLLWPDVWSGTVQNTDVSVRHYCTVPTVLSTELVCQLTVIATLVILSLHLCQYSGGRGCYPHLLLCHHPLSLCHHPLSLCHHPLSPTTLRQSIKKPFQNSTVQHPTHSHHNQE